MTASAWTEDRIDRLRTLWLEGHSAARIARELGAGLTRSAVLGKVHRMGLSAGRPRPRGASAVVRSPPRDRRPPFTPVSEAIAGPAAVPNQGRTTLLSVRRCECRWPFGDPKAEGFSLCGRPVERGAFCGPHAAVAYRPVRQTPESLEALAGLH
ncbi:GcrA family cell cycle regulator [uncultured Brevundimonas sp.]|uniref:GcrA family cell cycle regulator n=1 Tax=uncultured Brevundimonas sp. TaxID=213418 RepID=UPI0030EBD2D8|tara:strand:- start:32991 stop:33452 length:462 start_codon:yes stop_codon:yes gene_type:complete